MHSAYRFSVTIHSDDIAVIHCLRALSQFSQKTGNVRIPWGGTKQEDWERDGHTVTFHFSHPDYRSDFLDLARRLLAKTWQETKRDDNNPASPQS